ncbi:MAG: Smr/MutS family protein, partial [Ktedonobacterales bacterium]
ASVEFDVETLSPTYHLSIGLPGRSNALAIASRLGLPQDIITRSRDFLGSAGVEMESLLENLQEERRTAADERYRLSMERAEAEHQRRELERQRADLEERRERIINDARAQARREVESIQAELARIRTEVARKSLSHDRLTALRGRTRALEEKAAPLPSRMRAPIEEPSEDALPGPLQVGDTVRVRSMNQRGELVSAPDARGEVEVQLGALKLRVRASDVERLSRRQARATEGRPLLTLPPRQEVEAPDTQLDLRGWRVEEALLEVDRYLNDAYLAGMPFVRILHGKGTGALRQAIREELGRSPMVKSFASAPANEGGDGVTVVTLNTR